MFKVPLIYWVKKQEMKLFLEYFSRKYYLQSSSTSIPFLLGYLFCTNFCSQLSQKKYVIKSLCENWLDKSCSFFVQIFFQVLTTKKPKVSKKRTEYSKQWQSLHPVEKILLLLKTLLMLFNSVKLKVYSFLNYWSSQRLFRACRN